MSRCETIYERAMEAEEFIVAVGAARELRGCLELLGKLSGELQSSRTTSVAISLTQIQALDIGALTQEQIGLLYDRVRDESIRHIECMSSEEIAERLAALTGNPAGSFLGTAANQPLLLGAQEIR